MHVLPNPFMFNPESRPRFDQEALFEAITEAMEPAPAFLSDPSPEYLRAVDLKPIVEVLFGASADPRRAA